MTRAISVENLGKQYVIGHQRQESYATLRETMMHHLRSIAATLRHPLTPNTEQITQEEFWALRQVNFELEAGDRLGIIGPNGAGKSTLLKLLGRITQPSEGRIMVHGRIASLLEVGTGFHPELTGRENIYLNGAILGMSRSEIRRKFDEIVDFAGAEQFLDTPVKRYSSGMTVRLAFAVAAHLDPEILLIDEVLAVGDAEFQKKCLGKMDEVAGTGRTILFVSHNMNAVEQLCNRCLLLRNGRVEQDSADTRAVISGYLGGHSAENRSTWINPGSRHQNEWFQPQRLMLQDSRGEPVPGVLANDEDLLVLIEGEIARSDNALQVGFALYDDGGQLVCWSFHTDAAQAQWPELRPGPNMLAARLPARLLNQGRYHVKLLVALYHRKWILGEDDSDVMVSFEIHGGLSDSPYWMQKRPGTIAPVIAWESGIPVTEQRVQD